ncbi:MAG: LD-carboxypeptidase [Firmicutes bacterium]|jgi:muramoyltetrapeptide carboxypeptidase|nr:LD-carboxypeptidase [Bacillota bacterium]
MKEGGSVIWPKKLAAGSTVGLVATSSPITEYEKECSIRSLENMGYRVNAASNLTDNSFGYAAGSCEDRGKWINRMFADPEVDGIFCVRGGYGASRILEYVDLENVRKNPKIFVGFSDVTALHLLFNQSCHLVTFHGPMVSTNMMYDFDSESADSFARAVQDQSFEFKNPKGFEIGVIKKGCAAGRVTGGNLSVLCGSMGTPYEMDSRDKILFIEEVNEPMGRIERMLCQLKHCNKFKECKGVMLGQFEGCGNRADETYEVIRLFEDLLSDYDIPVMFNIQSGHGKPMLTIPLGALCTVDTESKRILFSRS